MLRRKFLKLSAGGLLGVSAGMSCNAQPAGTSAVSHDFTASEAELLRSLIETMHPQAVDRKPLSLAAVLDRLSALLRSMNGLQQLQIHVLLFLFEFGPPLLAAMPHRCSTLLPEERVSYWRGWQESSFILLRSGGCALRSLLALAIWQDTGLHQGIGMESPMVPESGATGERVASYLALVHPAGLALSEQLW